MVAPFMFTLTVNEVVLVPSVTFTEIEVVLTVPVTNPLGDELDQPS